MRFVAWAYQTVACGRALNGQVWFTQLRLAVGDDFDQIINSIAAEDNSEAGSPRPQEIFLLYQAMIIPGNFN